MSNSPWLRHCFFGLGGASSTGISFLGLEFDAEVKSRAFRAIICCGSSGVVKAIVVQLRAYRQNPHSSCQNNSKANYHSGGFDQEVGGHVFREDHQMVSQKAVRHRT